MPQLYRLELGSRVDAINFTWTDWYYLRDQLDKYNSHRGRHRHPPEPVNYYASKTY